MKYNFFTSEAAFADVSAVAHARGIRRSSETLAFSTTQIFWEECSG